LSLDIRLLHSSTPAVWQGIVSLPHPITEGDENSNPYYSSESEVKGRARTIAVLLNNFWRRWRTEYIREFHCTTGNNSQKAKKVDDTPRTSWKLVIPVMKDVTTVIRAVNIHMSSGIG